MVGALQRARLETGRSLSVICRRIPLPSMMNRPLRVRTDSDPHLPESVAEILQQDAVVLRNFVGKIRHQRDVDFAKATLLTGSLDPGQVCVHTVNRNSDDLQETR